MYKKIVRLLLLLIVCSFSNYSPIVNAKEKTITIGSKNFTEQYVLAEIAKQLLEKHGFTVNLVSNLPTVVLRGALEQGDIDVYYEYTGTAYSILYQQSESDLFYQKEALYQWVKEKDSKKGLTWLTPLPFNNTYVLSLKRDEAISKNLFTLSALAEYIKNNHNEKLQLGVYAEAWERLDGIKQVEKRYNFNFPVSHVRKMDQGLIYFALLQDYIDIAVGTMTDGFIMEYDLVVLEDDKGAFPIYHPAPVVRKEVLVNYPELEAILNQLSQRLTISTMRMLNAQVQVEHKPISVVIEQWLKQEVGDLR